MRRKTRTTEPSLWGRVYRSVIEPVIRWGVLAGVTLGPYAVGENTAIAEEMKPQPKPPTPTAPAGKNPFYFPPKERLKPKIETEYQTGTDSSLFGFTLTEIDEDGKPLFGDRVRFYTGRLPDGTRKTDAGVRVPFGYGGYNGNIKLYGMEHKDDDGLGIRLASSYGRWLFGGVFERAELGGDDQELKGLGGGRKFDSDLGETIVELWGYEKAGERFGNLFLFQNFRDGYSGGLSLTGGDKENRDFSASVGRLWDDKSWRVHGSTALDGRRFSLGGSFILDPDPRFATLPYGYLNHHDGVKSYQELWPNAMGYYLYQRLAEKGKRLVLHFDYNHNEGSDGITAQAAVRPFLLFGSDSDLLKRIHTTVRYDRTLSGGSGHDDVFTWGAGMDMWNGIGPFVEVAEGKKPVVGIRLGGRRF